MIILYDFPRSSNALKVRFLLEELGLTYRSEVIPQARPRPADYLALNPLGGVPALDDKGFLLTESNTMLRYLADREGRDDLYPPDLAGRARVDELLDRWSTSLRSALFRVEAKALGYTNVKHLAAGISGWKKAGEKTEAGK